MALVSSKKPVYSVVGFSRAKGGVAIESPRPARDEINAKRLAERLAGQRVGAIVLSRMGDPEIGEFDDPVEVARFGTVPAEFEMLLLGI